VLARLFRMLARRFPLIAARFSVKRNALRGTR